MHEAPGTAEGSCFFILLSHFSITVDTIHWWILRVFYHVLLSCQYLFDGMYFPKDLFHLPLLSGEVGRETFSVP